MQKVVPREEAGRGLDRVVSGTVDTFPLDSDGEPLQEMLSAASFSSDLARVLPKLADKSRTAKPSMPDVKCKVHIMMGGLQELHQP